MISISDSEQGKRGSKTRKVIKCGLKRPHQFTVPAELVGSIRCPVCDSMHRITRG